MNNETMNKVIEGLRRCLLIHRGATLNESCNVCPYQKEQGQTCEATELVFDALALLKAQEPKPPIIKENSYGWKFYYCPSCQKEFYQNNRFSFCEKCGQAVKWE